MVISDDPRTRKASHLLDASIAISARSLGTLSPKKTTFIIIQNEKIKDTSVIDKSKRSHIFIYMID